MANCRQMLLKGFSIAYIHVSDILFQSCTSTHIIRKGIILSGFDKKKQSTEAYYVYLKTLQITSLPLIFYTHPQGSAYSRVWLLLWTYMIVFVFYLKRKKTAHILL